MRCYHCGKRVDDTCPNCGGRMACDEVPVSHEALKLVALALLAIYGLVAGAPTIVAVLKILLEG